MTNLRQKIANTLFCWLLEIIFAENLEISSKSPAPRCTDLKARRFFSGGNLRNMRSARPLHVTL